MLNKKEQELFDLIVKHKHTIGVSSLAKVIYLLAGQGLLAQYEQDGETSGGYIVGAFLIREVQRLNEVDLNSDPDWVEVSSSRIRRWLYKPEMSMLGVQFTDGTIYRYQDVTQEQWDALQAAESKGKALNSIVIATGNKGDKMQ